MIKNYRSFKNGKNLWSLNNVIWDVGKKNMKDNFVNAIQIGGIDYTDLPQKKRKVVPSVTALKINAFYLDSKCIKRST